MAGKVVQCSHNIHNKQTYNSEMGKSFAHIINEKPERINKQETTRQFSWQTGAYD